MVGMFDERTSMGKAWINDTMHEMCELDEAQGMSTAWFEITSMI